MTFFLGVQMVAQQWWDAAVPLFISRRRLADRRTFPQARAQWALDSGGYTELAAYGQWRTTEDAYVREVLTLQREVGMLAWVAPQDWVCDPVIVAETRLTLEYHQELTVKSFVSLRDRVGPLVVPMLQGWTLDDYLWCAELYHRAGVDLAAEPVVGLGSIAGRQAHAAPIVQGLAAHGFRLHGFGVKLAGLRAYASHLASADSMAWSFDGRRLKTPCPEGRSSCANCLHHALAWRDTVLAEVPAA